MSNIWHRFIKTVGSRARPVFHGNITRGCGSTAPGVSIPIKVGIRRGTMLRYEGIFILEPRRMELEHWGVDLCTGADY